MYNFPKLEEKHLNSVAQILNYYVLNSIVTFHTHPLDEEGMREKVFFTSPIYRAFLIMENNSIIGYCAITPWKKQEAYRHTAEINIYIDKGHTGKGIGLLAIQHLEQWAKENDIRVLIAGACSENIPSIRLFEKSGFQQCAFFRGLGHKFGKILDMVYLQKQL